MKFVRFEILTAVLLLQSFEGSYCCHLQGPAFQEALLLLFECVALKMEALIRFETSGIIRRKTRRHIAEELSRLVTDVY